MPTFLAGMSAALNLVSLTGTFIPALGRMTHIKKLTSREVLPPARRHHEPISARLAD